MDIIIQGKSENYTVHISHGLNKTMSEVHSIEMINRTQTISLFHDRFYVVGAIRWWELLRRLLKTS